jgi:hypothetical protein
MNDRWVARTLVVLSVTAVAALLVGLGLAVGNVSQWRWTVWAGLVALAAVAVVGWLSRPPDPLPAPGPEGTRTNSGAADETETEDGPVAPGPDGTRTNSGPRNIRARNGFWLTRLFADTLEPFFAWLIAYPLFPLQIFLFWAISWFDFAGALGVPDLVWADEWWVRVWVGISVSMLFGNALFMRGLLDRRPGSMPPDFGERFSLFWFARRDGDDEIRQIGAYLARAWAIALVVFYAPAVGRDWSAKVDRPGMMLLGLALGVLLTYACVWIGYHWRWLWTADWFFRRFPVLRDWNPPLATLAGIFELIPFFALVLLLTERTLSGLFWNSDAIWSPVWLFCLFAALFNAVYGFITIHLAGLQYVLAGLLVAAVVVCNTNYPDKMSFPGLETYTDLERARRPNLDEDPKAPDPPLDLIETEALLAKFQSKWAQGRGAGELPVAERKPKLVIVAATGGGIQAAVWTSVVLEGLEERLRDRHGAATPLRDHIRLMVGASGGMQAAALYAADFKSNPKAWKLSDRLAEDSLWPTVQTMLINDGPALAWPGSLSRDRGRSLEERWERNCSPWTKDGQPSPPPTDWFRLRAQGYRRGESPLAKHLYDLRADERACDAPVLVFSPMMVEDCRRVIISNLSMEWFTHTDVTNLNDPAAPYQPKTHPDRLSVPAVEFWRYFPDARPTFKVGTAARMSATFPFVGPAVSLPSNPPRRVVDAGYFDNFGLNMAGIWLVRHRELLRKYTSGVVLVEIRAYPRREEKLRFRPVGQPGAESFNWALAEFGSPFQALYNLYARGAYFRNDQLLDYLDEELNGPRKTRPKLDPTDRFFASVAFECDLDSKQDDKGTQGSLSWTLPKRGVQDIRDQFTAGDALQPGVAKQVELLGRWFDTGGTH